MKVKALGNINSGQYIAGDEFELVEEEALMLIEAGAVASLEETIEAKETEPVQPVSIPPTEAPATDIPLEPTPPQTGTVETPPAQEPSSPALKNEGKQPTAAEIAQTVAASEASSTNLPDVHIS